MGVSYSHGSKFATMCHVQILKSCSFDSFFSAQNTDLFSPKFPTPEDPWEWYISHYMKTIKEKQPNVGIYIYHTWMVWEQNKVDSKEKIHAPVL